MKKNLKQFSYFLAVGLAAALITGCAKQPDKDQIVVQVNNYAVTVDDLKYEAKMVVPGAGKELILQDIITKELLLQEAQKMELDKNKLFMKEIENYWKQSLIKRLINIKGEEFLAKAKVSAAQVKAEYSRLSEESAGKIEPYAQIAGQIQERLRIKQAQVLLDNWINGLKKSANIKRNEVVFNDLKLRGAKNLAGGADGE